jgi:hypothetical protein
MSPEDRARYAPGVHANTYAEDQNPPNKTCTLERTEQKDFANWCLGRGYWYLWHATHKKSTASKGCPDFGVIVNGKTYWIEFKLPGSDLSKDQKENRALMEKNGGTYFIAYSSHEAMRIIDPDCR